MLNFKSNAIYNVSEDTTAYRSAIAAPFTSDSLTTGLNSFNFSSSGNANSEYSSRRGIRNTVANLLPNWLFPQSNDAKNSAVTGSLGGADPINPTRPNTYRHDHWFQNPITGQVRVSLASTQFDTFLQIVDYKTGQVIASNDDSSGGTNSQITFNFQANTPYLLRVTSYSTFATGTYQLSTNYRLSESTLTPSSGFNSTSGYGLVDAAAAVARAINQPRFADITTLDNPAWGLNIVSAPEAWARGFTGKNITVAVVDTGVDYTHTDLNDNIWTNSREIFGNNIDDDNNGFVDDGIGWNFVDSNNNPIDVSGHGTHVAGTIAAENNGIGMTGVAYNAKIMPVRVLSDDGGSDANVAAGIRYAVNNGADVINLSLGGTGSSDVVTEAVKYATDQGAIVIMAAGNNGDSTPFYPAQLATNWGIAVGAIDEYGTVANFSNRAGTNATLNYLVAPGVDVYSTVRNTSYAVNSYDYMTGTSMATPHVSGVVALMLSANPNLSPAQVRQILMGTADAVA